MSLSSRVAVLSNDPCVFAIILFLPTFWDLSILTNQEPSNNTFGKKIIKVNLASEIIDNLFHNPFDTQAVNENKNKNKNKINTWIDVKISVKFSLYGIYSPQFINLGEKSDLSAGWTKTFLKKRSIDVYVSIFQKRFRSRCTKYGFSVGGAE